MTDNTTKANYCNESIVIIIIFILFVIAMIYFMFHMLDTDRSISNKFCIYKDFDYAPSLPSGKYKDYKGKDYGRVSCVKCYVEGCEIKDFNVTKVNGFFGYKLEEVE